MAGDVLKAGESRVWLFEDGFGPGRGKEYFGFARIGDPTFGFGDIERIEAPSEDRFNEFVQIDSIQGAKERPTASIIARYPRADLSSLLRIGRKRCASGVLVHLGKCANPQDFDANWDKVLVFTDVKYSSYSGENFGALGSDEQAAANETGEFSADDMYEVKPLLFGEQLSTVIAREITKVLACDTIECGDCDEPSDGCQKVFALQIGVGATPGTNPSVVYSDDGGATGDSLAISTLFSNETPGDAVCVGGDMVIVAGAGGIHINDFEDILDGTDNWVEVTSGLVAAKGPLSITSVGPSHTWMGATGGYIYFTDDPRGGVSVQDAGVATIQDLEAIHALDKLNVVAVGDLNAVVYTTNGGSTWQSLTGPAVGVNLTAVWMYDARLWLVGDANGDLWRTSDAGVTWTEITLPITPTALNDIRFFDSVVGYLGVTVAGPAGRMLRTIDGGQTFQTMPERAGSIPANDEINSVAVCARPNVVWGGGLGDNGSDGILVKAS
jgi:photosystem II stability/assembly factor-like uncharacterized protein